MKIALSSDHAGYPLKQHLVEYLREQGYEVLDLGVDTDGVSSDYTDAALRVGHAVKSGEVERGLLVCGSGIGASIAANKIKGVYCAIAHDTYSAAQGVEHDNMNVLALGARVIGVAAGETLADAFLSATFDTTTERYGRRFRHLQEIEERGE